MRPFMVEFTGTPDAGKTTAIRNVQNILEAENFKVHVIRESAELVPSEFPKWSWDATVWMRHITCAEILRALYIPCDIVLIDRGVLDAKFFGLKFFKCGDCSSDDYVSYMGMFAPNLEPDILISLVATPEASLFRKGRPSEVVNKDFLKDYNRLFHSFYETISSPKTLIETSNMSIEAVSNQVLEIIHDSIKAR